MNLIRRYAVHLAFLVSVVAMSGSLYFSEVKHFAPCDWCWYQRILMYPLVLILGISIWKKDHMVHRYVLPISMLGATMGTIHYLEQKAGLLTRLFGDTCSNGIPCSGMYINWGGFITIPFLSLTAFILIFLLMSLHKKQKQ